MLVQAYIDAIPPPQQRKIGDWEFTSNKPRNRNHSHPSRNPGDDTGYYHTNPGIGSREGSNYNIPEGYQNEVGEQKRRHPHEPHGY